MKKTHYKILDSAMGSEIIKRGEILPDHIWSAQTNINNPDLVYSIHKDNILSGATHITTNTFRTTPRAYSKTIDSYNKAKSLSIESMKSAVYEARRAAKQDTLILGSIAPLEDCYMPNLYPGDLIARTEFEEIGLMLAKEGVDILFLETMNSISETITCIKSINPLGLPIWVSFALNEKNTLLSGDQLFDAIKVVEKCNVSAILLNCTPISIISKSIRSLNSFTSINWGIYPNLGLGNPNPEGNIKHIHSDETFSSLIKDSIKEGGSIFGGCCGSNINHIKIIKNLLNSGN